MLKSQTNNEGDHGYSESSSESGQSSNGEPYEVREAFHFADMNWLYDGQPGNSFDCRIYKSFKKPQDHHIEFDEPSEVRLSDQIGVLPKIDMPEEQNDIDDLAQQNLEEVKEPVGAGHPTGDEELFEFGDNQSFSAPMIVENSISDDERSQSAKFNNESHASSNQES